ncbi:MAG: hypothetical protein MUC99_02075 [Anaerolineae bacterium]|jgi:anti-sigma factor RsiW|nr:hypothetical protein [Anaerolineae bacterium]
MSDNTARRLQRVQEALDAPLSPDQEAALQRDLSADGEAARAARRLERVHDLLSAAPRERAPERLAGRLMARISQIMASQKKRRWPVPRGAVSVAIALANAAALPLMTGAAWLMIHAAARPELARTVLPRVIMTHLMLIEVMVQILREAESVAHDDPDTAAAILRLLPEALRAVSQALDDDNAPTR